MPPSALLLLLGFQPVLVGHIVRRARVVAAHFLQRLESQGGKHAKPTTTWWQPVSGCAKFWPGLLMSRSAPWPRHMQAYAR